MRRTEALQGVRMIKFLNVLGRSEAAEFSQLEAAELLGVGERTFRRWHQRFENDGEAGLLDRRLVKGLGKLVPLGQKWRRFTGRAMPASRPSTFTDTSCATTSLTGLHVDEDVSSIERAAGACPAARGESSQAAPAAPAGDDAASGRLTA
jgi:Winged helix-turn helix